MLFNSDRPEIQKNQVKSNAGGNMNTYGNIHHLVILIKQDGVSSINGHTYYKQFSEEI